MKIHSSLKSALVFATAIFLVATCVDAAPRKKQRFEAFVPVVASESAILEGIEKAYGGSKEEDLEQVMQSMQDMDEADVELQADAEEIGLADLEKAADEAPIVKLVNLILYGHT